MLYNRSYYDYFKPQNSVMLHRCKPNNKNYYFLNDIQKLYYYLTLAELNINLHGQITMV